MSDDLRFSLVISEGPHDVEAAAKVLRLKKFQRARKLHEVPALLQAVIPRHYPSENKDGELCRIVAHPSFLFKENYWILLSNANGESNLGGNLDEILSPLSKQYVDTTLRGIAVLADADAKNADGKRRALFSQLSEAFADGGDLALDPAKPDRIRVFAHSRPFGMYIFPDCQSCGTLERVLLAGAQNTYPELLKEAEKYVAYAKTLLYAKNLTSGSNGEKAVVGVIANALRPGKANQVSIHDDDWFTKESLPSLALHQALSEFIDTIIQWGR